MSAAPGGHHREQREMIDPDHTITGPTTPREWADALDAATAAQVARLVDGELDLHSAAGELLSFVRVNGVAAGVSLAGEELHTLHGLSGSALLSADGEWLATWREQDGYWAGEHYQPRE